MDCKLTKLDGVNDPFVSVIIPTYNEEVYLPQCLSSLQRVNYPPNRLEIIVVDNGSTDKTPDIARMFRTNLVLYSEGTTISAVRNYGANHAQGSILAFLDADCIVTENWLSNAVTLLTEETGGIGVVGSRPVSPDEGATWVQKARAAVLLKNKNMITCWLSSSNFILKKELFDRVGGFDESLETCEDADLSFRLNKITTILYSPYVKALHLREPKTLWEFFTKEVWHGKSSYVGIFRHGLKKEEFLSIIVPTIYLINFCLFLVGFALRGWAIVIITQIIFWGIPAAMTARTILRRKKLFSVHQLYIIDLVYLLARTVSIIYSFTGTAQKINIAEMIN